MLKYIFSTLHITVFFKMLTDVKYCICESGQRVSTRHPLHTYTFISMLTDGELTKLPFE